MDFQALADLIRTNPDWETLNDDELAAWCNAEAVTSYRDRLGVDEFYQLIDGAEWSGLSQEQKDEVMNIAFLHASTGIPTAQGMRARSRLVEIFETRGTATKNAVVAALAYQATRCAAAGIGQNTVNSGEVAYARANP